MLLFMASHRTRPKGTCALLAHMHDCGCCCALWSTAVIHVSKAPPPRSQTRITERKIHCKAAFGVGRAAAAAFTDDSRCSVAETSDVSLLKSSHRPVTGANNHIMYKNYFVHTFAQCNLQLWLLCEVLPKRKVDKRRHAVSCTDGECKLNHQII